MKKSISVILFLLQFAAIVEAKESLFDLTRNDQVIANAAFKLFYPIESDSRVLVPTGTRLRVVDVRTESFAAGSFSGVPDIIGFKTYYFEKKDCLANNEDCLFKIRQGVSNRFSAPSLQQLGLSIAD